MIEPSFPNPYEALFDCVLCEDKVLSLDNYILHLPATATVYSTRGPLLWAKELPWDSNTLYDEVQETMETAQALADMAHVVGQKRTDSFSFQEQNLEQIIRTITDAQKLTAMANTIVKSQEKQSTRVEDTKIWYPEKEEVGYTRIGGTRWYRCDSCPFTSGFVQHMRTHTKCHNRDRVLHECEHCGIKFSQQANLQRHVARHINPPLHPCPCCNKRFYRKDQKNEHIITHMDMFPITLNCPVDHCNKIGESRRDLKDHMLAHSRNDFLVCKHCRRIYAHPLDLYKHAIKMFGDAIDANPQIVTVNLALKSKEETAERGKKKEAEQNAVKKEPMLCLDGLQFHYNLPASPNQTSLEFLSEICRYAFMPMLSDIQSSTSSSADASPTNP